MKKIFLYCLLTMFSIAGLRGQYSEDKYAASIPQIIPSSPQSNIFEKYVNHPVVEYNGLAEISIPLYEIEVKGLKIPIILNYHPGGVKCNLEREDIENAIYMKDGDVGVGWSISAGGYRISRTINGKDDFKAKIYPKNLVERYPSSDKCGLDIFHAMLNYPKGLLPNPMRFIGESNSWDGEYDLFTYILPQANGNFILDRGQTPRILGNDSFIMSIQKENMKITDNNGFSYYMGTYPDGQMLCEKSMVTWPSSAAAEDNISGWPLKRIESPLNEWVEFKYSKFEVVRKTRALKIKNPAYHCPLSCWSYNNFIEIQGSDPFYQKITHEEQLIDEIKTDNVTVRFKRKGVSMPQNLVTEIEVLDKSGEIIKVVQLKYQLPTYNNWHCMLSSVRIKNKNGRLLKEFKMDYYPPPTITFDEAYPDQWGYYAKGDGSSDKISLHSEFLDFLACPKTSDEATQFKKLRDIIGYNERLFFVSRSKDNEDTHCFSLKKITYPTRGYTEYIYEANRYLKHNEAQPTVAKGGGQRIKKINSYDENGQLAKTTEYRYGLDEDGNGKVDIVPEARYYADYSVQVGYKPSGLYDCNSKGEGMISDVYVQAIGIVSSVLTLSVNPVLPEISSQNVNYEQVSIIEYDEKEKKANGKTVITYKIPERFNKSTMILHNPRTIDHTQTYTDYDRNMFHNLTDIRNYYWGMKPLPIERKVYNENNSLISEEFYQYRETPNMLFDGMKTKERVFFDQPQYVDIATSSGPDGLGLVCYRNFVWNLYDYLPYNIHSKSELLSSKKTINYYDAQKVELNETYQYNTKNQLINTTYLLNDGRQMVKEFKYPADFLSAAIYQKMNDRNMISSVIVQSSKIENQPVGVLRTNYTDAPAITGGLILPASQELSLSEESNLRVAITYDRYDSRGNLQQFRSQDSIPTVYLWGYNGQYPIAEIKGATYEQIRDALGGESEVQRISNSISLSASDNTKINNLRSNVTLPDIMITTYTYKPLAGMLTATDPRGVTTYYEYDLFHRLSLVKDAEEKKVSSYEYNYVPVYEPLTASLKCNEYTYPYPGSGTFSFSTSGGSGTFKYRWVMKNASGAIVSQNNNSSKQFSVNYSQIGRMTLSGTVEDVETGHIREMSIPLEVRKTINFTNVTTSNYFAEGYLDLMEPMTITFVVSFSNSNTGATASFDVGNTRLNYNTSGYPTSQAITLPAGRTRCSVSVSGIYGSGYTYASMHFYPPSGVATGSPNELKAAYQY